MTITRVKIIARALSVLLLRMSLGVSAAHIPTRARASTMRQEALVTKVGQLRKCVMLQRISLGGHSQLLDR